MGIGIDTHRYIVWERERERDSSSPMNVYYGVSHAYNKHTFIRKGQTIRILGAHIYLER